MKNKRFWHYIRSYRFNSLFFKNLIIILIIILLPLSALDLVLYKHFDNGVQKEIKEASNNELYRISNIFNNMFNEMYQISTKILVDDDVITFFYSNRDQLNNFVALNNSIFNTINKVNNYVYMDNIYLFAEKNKYVISPYGGQMIELFADNQWYKEYEKNKEIKNLWGMSRQNGMKDSYANYLTIFKNVYLDYPNCSGTIAYNINIERLMEITNGTINQTIILTDKSGRILFNNNNMDSANNNINVLPTFDDLILEDNDRYSLTKGKDKMIVLVDHSPYNDFEYILAIPLKHYQDKIDNFRNLIIMVIVLTFVFAIIISFIISVNVFEPVKIILSVIEDSDEYIDDMTVDDTSKLNEIKYIVQNIKGYIDNNQKLGKELKRRLLLLRKTQMVALQSQINPHFLHNTLETIKWKAIGLTRSDNEVSMMITYLSRLMRISIETNDIVTSIAEEVEHARLYLEIQQIRYEDKLDIHWDINEEIMKYKIVKITLQPLIENAIYHGIKPKEGKGKIIIKGYKNKDQIIIELIDDGVGMNSSIQQKINRYKPTDDFIEDTHIGVINVNRRIKLIFGDDYGITVKSTNNVGTSLHIKLPAQL